MIIAAFIVEVPLSKNALLYTFPQMIVMIPLAVCIYSFITYMPKWIIEKRLGENRARVFFLTLVWFIVSILAFITNSRIIS